MTYTLEHYEAKDGWRWRMKAANGEIVADSAEAYDSESNVKRAMESIAGALLVADYE